MFGVRFGELVKLMKRIVRSVYFSPGKGILRAWY